MTASAHRCCLTLCGSQRWRAGWFDLLFCPLAPWYCIHVPIPEFISMAVCRLFEFIDFFAVTDKDRLNQMFASWFIFILVPMSVLIGSSFDIKQMVQHKVRCKANNIILLRKVCHVDFLFQLSGYTFASFFSLYFKSLLSGGWVDKQLCGNLIHFGSFSSGKQTSP